jgi:hypothetical protein
MTSDPAPSGPDRRRFLKLGGLSALGVALGACATDETGASGDAGATTGPSSAGGAGSTIAGATAGAPAALTAADFDGLAICTVVPEQTAGPFALDEQFDRRDITEGFPGHPLRLGLRVVDAACAPVAGAAVEVWHTDATGDYSAFADGGGGKDEAEGSTFLRGTQTADEQGIVEFQSIYPGWYPGRAVHVHVRVRVDDDLVVTTQLYFDDAATEAVLTTGPYAEFGPPGTTNAEDGFAGDAAESGLLLVTTTAETTAGAGTLALLNIGVRA